jgi:DNA-binding transcriptional LysR family regulator
MFDWNDVKALLAVGRGGSTAAAARELGVNQTTVSRRLEALERDLGVRLVDRHQAGASLTEVGRLLVGDAEAMERNALGMRQTVETHQRGASGTVRITMSELTANTGLIPLLPEFRAAFPEITLELVITDDRLDLEAGQADIALRGGYVLPDSNLVARKISETDWALYCSREYANRMGLPKTLDDLKNHVLIGGDADRDFPGLTAILDRAPGAAVTLKSSSVTNLFESVRAGIAVGSMPCLLADLDPDLVQIFPPDPDTLSFTWMITRADLKDAPRVRAFMDFFGPRIAALTREYRQRGAAARSDRAEI